MIEFFYHDGIQKEIAIFERKFRTIREAVVIFERLCNTQFNPTKPQQVIAPAKLHRIIQNDIWTLWKIELIVPNSELRPNQYPRMWFVVKGASIAVLCMATHIGNYDDEKMNKVALSRVSGLF
ncbi:MAG TPA: hypothetical protein VI775_01785 [Candidatus Paceibacterota bacterium]